MYSNHKKTEHIKLFLLRPGIQFLTPICCICIFVIFVIVRVVIPEGAEHRTLERIMTTAEGVSVKSDRHYYSLTILRQ